MNFLVDAQLPKALAEFLCSKGYDAIHTLDLPLKNKTTDKDIIEISSVQKRVVISKDADFLQSFMVNGFPEKLVNLSVHHYLQSASIPE